MSAKAVTGDEGAGREAVLRAMQEASESVAGKKKAETPMERAERT